MTDWQRLEQVIKWTGLSTNAFASAIGLKRSENLYQIKRGNNRISKNLAELIAAKYPAVSPAWLLTDQGEMLMEQVSHVGGTADQGIPYYNMDVLRVVAAAETPRPSGCLSLPGFEDCTLAALAPTGDLDAALPSGAILLLQPVELSAMLLPDEIYVVTTDDFALLRYLKPDPTTVGGLLLETRNGVREPLPVHRDQLRKLFLVKGWVVRKVL